MPETTARIESEPDVRAYLQDLKYALDHGAKLTFQEDRLVDQHRDQRYTNRFTVADYSRMRVRLLR